MFTSAAKAFVKLAVLPACLILSPTALQAETSVDVQKRRPQPPPASTPAPIKAYTGEKITLDFQNTDLRRILRIIGRASGKNIVIPDSVNGRVTVKLQNVPWDQALELILSSSNLGFEESGNVLMIYELSNP